MQRPDYDVVIVGARCAGATLAAFLARAGARVLLLDKDALPSDQSMSTHGINPPGMDVLDDLGVGEAVRAATPAGRVIRLDTDGIVVDFEVPDGRAEYCPRRERLDGLIQKAAIDAGVELLDRTRVTSLVYHAGRVSGVHAVTGGRGRIFTGGIVVGADGRHSTIARLVGAEEYLGYQGPRAGFWGYWPAPSFWTSDPAYRFDYYFGHVDGLPRVIFPTDDNQLLIGSWPMTPQAGAWRAGMVPVALREDPVIGPLVRDSAPIGKIRGTLKERFFFRRAVGSGWALVGDAGHHKEFVIGDGIAEALLQARSLAAALACGTDAAVTRWWRARDVDAIPLYFLAKGSAAVERPPELQRLLLSRLDSRPALKARLSAVLLERELSSFGAALLPQLVWWGLSAALHRPRILGELLVAGWWGAGVARELRRRKRLLAAADAASGGDNCGIAVSMPNSYR